MDLQQQPVLRISPSTIQAMSSPQELRRVHQALSRELEALQASAAQLKEAEGRFGMCMSSLDQIIEASSAASDKEMLIPVTASLFYHGKILTAGEPRLKVDAGTGLMLEKDPQEAKAYYTRKLDLVSTQFKNIENKARDLVPMLKLVEERAASLSTKK